MEEKVAFKAIVSGLVQGVGFRYYTLRQAQKFHVTGYVKNLPDRTVEAYAEGEKEVLQQLIAAIRRGPLGSSVDNVDIIWLPFEDKYSRFDITY